MAGSTKFDSRMPYLNNLQGRAYQNGEGPFGEQYIMFAVCQHYKQILAADDPRAERQRVVEQAKKEYLQSLPIIPLVDKEKTEGKIRYEEIMLSPHCFAWSCEITQSKEAVAEHSATIVLNGTNELTLRGHKSIGVHRFLTLEVFNFPENVSYPIFEPDADITDLFEMFLRTLPESWKTPAYSACVTSGYLGR